MPRRTLPLVNHEYYHIYNRGVAKQPIFTSVRHYQRFLKTLLYYQLRQEPVRFSQFDPQKHLIDTTQRRVEIICYCLMPNHFHLLLRQTQDGGISEFISKFTNSYTKYYNTKELRVGTLLQGVFKAVHLGTEEQLLHLSRYIHLNPVTGFIVRRLADYRWSSYPEYIGLVPTNFCQKEVVLNQFASVDAYRSFVLDQADYAKRLGQIKHQALDADR